MKNFVIVGIQRTGTTMLVRTLRQHKNIHCLGEVFNGYSNRISANDEKKMYWYYIRRSLYNRVGHIVFNKKTIFNYLDDVFSTPLPERYTTIGFKLMLNQANQFPNVLKYIQIKQVPIIHIERRNVLKTLVSRLVNKNFDIAHTEKKITTPRIKIDTQNLVSNLIRLENANYQWEEKIKHNFRLKLTYENFVANKENELVRITDFLGVSSCKLFTPTVKLNPDKLSDTIINYDEVASLLSNTRFSKYLND